MRYDFQGGTPSVPEGFDFSVDAEISYNGLWWSLNDHYRFRLGVEGFGQHDQTFRRKTVTSSAFNGEYTVGSVKDNTKRTWQVIVRGSDQTELEQNKKDAIDWFTQDAFNVRVKFNEYMETWLCDQADYSVNQTHVNLHNCLAILTFTFSVHPTISREIIL